MTHIDGFNYIGTVVCKSGEARFQAVNPQTGQALPTEFFSATLEETDLAMTKAQKAFLQLKKILPAQKARFLEEIAHQIEALGEPLIERAHQETALPTGRLIGERGRTCNQLRMFANLVREGSWVEANIDTAQPERQPLPKPDIRKILVPIGPVVVFGASNFPLAFSTAGGDTASALAAGNPVVVKAHNAHPGTAELVAKAILKAVEICEMPEGTFSMVHDSGYTVGKLLVTHPLTKAVAFTGSLAGGKALFDLANQRPEPIPVFAEMGSINPVFLLEEALAKRAETMGQQYAQSVTLGTGQFCTNPGLLIGVKGAHLNTFIASFSQTLHDIAPSSMLTPQIQKNYQAHLEKALHQNGIDVIASASGTSNPQKSEAQPVIASTEAKVFLNNPTLHEEVFGPYTLLIQCNDTTEMQQVADALQGQLTVTVMAEAEELGETQQTLVTTLEEKTGRLIFNGVPTGVEVCPSMHHGGPYPATTDSRFTSVGTSAIKRFARPLSFQNTPEAILPEALRNQNTQDIWRLVNGEWSKENI
ncbi:aldehyde dehydrogenase (NADP(+)) [Rapidithrix thailandica]|uniref:Aldehyde dehydrogenase (NADP(+)) n=1 Tax=Rapidithrix thailandica TaxID=413964 RepID=A0AAW9S2P9_9BACT